MVRNFIKLFFEFMNFNWIYKPTILLDYHLIKFSNEIQSLTYNIENDTTKIENNYNKYEVHLERNLSIRFFNLRILNELNLHRV